MSTYKKLGTIPLADLMPLLEKKAPDLFEEIKSRVNWDGTTWSGSTRVHIPQSLAQRIDDWLVAQEPPKPTWRDTFNEDTAALLKRESKRLKDEREATARLEEWRSQGLVDNQHNANAVANFITTHSVLKGRFTVQAVDIAIDFLGRKGSNVLQWQQNLKAPPPAPAPKAWKAGDPLPDIATEAMLRDSSLAEVRAWSRRKQR